jgi:small conductance mechanosensitive channel
MRTIVNRNAAVRPRLVTLLVLQLIVSLAFFDARPVIAQENGAISTGDQTVSDREIDSRIEAIFDEIDGLQGVFVTVRAGVVTLRGKVTEAALAEQAEDLARRVKGVVEVSNRIGEVTSVSKRITPVYERQIQRFWQAVGYIPLFSVAVLAWAVIFLLGLLIARREWPWNRIAPNAFIAHLIRQIIRLAFFVSGVVLALDILGAGALLGTILGAAGIVGLAIGFAVRDTVENYIASILLSIRQPFRPKDYVQIEALEGFVIGLTSRATILLDLDGNHIRIPNATVFKSNITNYSRNPQRRFLFRLGVDPSCNLDLALEIGRQRLEAFDFVLTDPGPDAWIEEVGDSNVVLTFVAWIDQEKTGFLKARSEATRLVKAELEGNGIGLPEPTYRLIFADGATPAVSTAKRGTARKAPKPVESEAVNDTSPDQAVTKKVDAERAETAPKDLLDASAPNELEG